MQYTIENLKNVLASEKLALEESRNIALKTMLFFPESSPEHSEALDIIKGHYEKSAFSKIKTVYSHIVKTEQVKAYLDMPMIPVFVLYNEIQAGKGTKEKNPNLSEYKKIDSLVEQAKNAGLDETQAEKFGQAAKALHKLGLDTSQVLNPIKEAIAEQEAKTMLDNVLNWITNNASLDDCAIVQAAIQERTQGAIASVMQNAA
jgi:hypothetical protein